MNGVRVALLILAPSASEPAPDVPRVQVVFHLTEPTFSGNYSNATTAGEPSELVQFESQVTGLLVGALTESFPFLLFTSDPAPFTFTATLEKETLGCTSSGMCGTRIRCTTKGSRRVQSAQPLDIRYSSNTLDGSFRKSEGARMVDGKFREGIAALRDEFIARFFGRISLCSRVYLLHQQETFGALPFSYEDLGAVEGSRFLIEMDASPTPKRFATLGMPASSIPSPLPTPFDRGILVMDAGQPIDPVRKRLSELASDDGVVERLQLFVTEHCLDFGMNLGNDPASAIARP